MRLQLNKNFLMQSKSNESKLIFLLLAFLSVLFFLISYLSYATFDRGDGIRHYMMARYSWQHPMMLLDLWAKPLFTFLLSFFAQFGILGATVFQIVCGLLSSWFCFRIAKKLQIANALLIPVFVFFAPIYFAVVNSGLTEPFFGLTIVCSVFLLTEKKYIWSAIVISFLPFARNEGFLFLPAFALVFFLRKQYVSIFFLAAGTILLSLIGFVVFRDIAWLFSHNPYKGHQDIYGHGELLHFVKEYNQILGLPLSCLFLAGLLWMGFRIVQIKKSFQTNFFFSEELFLIFGCLSIYFVGHSIFWWKGLFSSFGLIRMMAGVVPLAAIICLRGFNLLLSPLQKYLQQKVFPYVSIGITLICLTLVIRAPFKQYYFPFQLSIEDKTVAAAAEWYQNSGIKNKKIYFLHPFLPFTLNADPFNSAVMQELWGLDKVHPEKSIEEDALIFWDSHYSPNEGELKLESLLNNPNFVLLQKAKPGIDFPTLGGNNFEVYLFLKKKKGESYNNSVNAESDILSIAKVEKENDSLIINKSTLFTDNPDTASLCFKLTDLIEYGPGLKRKVADIKDSDKIVYISVKSKIKPDETFKDVFFVFEVADSKSNILLWEKKEIKISNEEINQLHDEEVLFQINPTLANKENNFRIYIWNFGRKKFLISNIEIAFKSSFEKGTIVVW